MSPRSQWRAIAADVVVSGIIPTIVYYWLTSTRHWTEAQALTGVIVFPALMGFIDIARDRTVNVFSAMAMAGIVLGLAAAYIGGDPKMLLIRESFFTVILGTISMGSLLSPRPLAYWFARAALQRLGPDKLKDFETKYAHSRAIRRGMKSMTASIGALFLVEFITKVVMVYTLSVEAVLVAAPIVLNVIALGGTAVIVFYSRAAMRRNAEADGLPLQIVARQ